MRVPVPASRAEVGGQLMLIAFAATLGLSALLLFSVQPMVAKMLLPVLGGAPATWAVSLCFFQALLLGGYAYAHLLGSKLRPRWMLVVHASLLLAAFAALPIRLPSDLEPPQGSPYLWLLAMLSMVSGLPFFTLSASAPLLQLWFARLGHRRSADPYFLYSASNAGSLIALLAYPTLIEPLLGMSLQSNAWRWSFLALGFAIIGCGLAVLSQERQAFAWPSDKSSQMAARPLSWEQRMAWIFLSFVPSGLLVAYTTYLTTDLASAPLLWALPLALYLATFIAVFRKRAFIPAGVLLGLQPLLAAGAVAAYEWKGDYSWAVSALVGMLAFVITCLVCHAQLYKHRPEAQQLTDYYLCISLGGVLGGVFAAILAPLVFPGTLEFPLLLGLGMLGHPKVWRTLGTGRGIVQLGLMTATAVVGIFLFNLLLASEVLLQAHADLRLQVVCTLGLVVVAAMRWARVATAALAAMIVATAALPSASGVPFIWNHVPSTNPNAE